MQDARLSASVRIFAGGNCATKGTYLASFRIYNADRAGAYLSKWNILRPTRLQLQRNCIRRKVHPFHCYQFLLAFKAKLLERGSGSVRSKSEEREGERNGSHSLSAFGYIAGSLSKFKRSPSAFLFLHEKEEEWPVHGLLRRKSEGVFVSQKSMPFSWIDRLFIDIVPLVPLL